MGEEASLKMLTTIGEYQLTDILHEGARYIVHRGRHKGRGEPVVVKLPRPGEGIAERRRSLEREWRMLCELRGSAGVVAAVALERHGSDCALVLEDFGATSLEHLGLAGMLPVQEALSLASKLVDALEQIHRKGIVHRKFEPSNLLLRPTDGLVKAIDFAAATQVVSETPVLAPTERPLAYLSPELTGRTRRLVDYRSDYYSLGVTLYELFTGALPFNYADPLELVHAHLALEPREPRELNATLPDALSRVVLKLLAKDAEERYQSIAGIRSDLARCAQALADGRADFAFDPGRDDAFEGFRAVESVRGREAILARLVHEFEASLRGGGRVVVVTGPAGVGKSALVSQLALPIGTRRGQFAGGKFEQFEQAVPYQAFGQVIERLVAQLLTEPPEVVETWRARFISEGTTTLQALSELCPLLGRFIASQRELPVLSPSESKARLHDAMRSFVASLATPERPLCLFIDDVQWASADSLLLLKHLALGARSIPLLLVLAARNDDARGDTPLAALTAELEGEGTPVETLSLGALEVRDVALLVRDCLPVSETVALDLAQVVVARTGGNPFFAKAFLRTAHADGLLELRTDRSLDIERIRHIGITDNVVELLVKRIDKLPAPTRELLQVAACVGNSFPVVVLEQVSGTSGQELWPAILADLVIPLDQVHSSIELGHAAANVRCRFAHDRVQQAAASMLDPTRQAEVHRSIGTRLHAEALESGSTAALLEAAIHLNRALAVISAEHERVALARLDLSAANAALGRAAAAEALQLAEAGLRALGSTAWERHYELTRDLTLTASEASFAAGLHERLGEFAARVRELARSPLDCVRVQRLEGQVAFAQFRLDDASRTYRDALARLGVLLPEAPTEDQIGDEMRATAESLGRREPEQLLALPRCEDERITLAMEVLSRLIFVAGTSNSPLLPIVACRLVRLSLEHGNSPESANGYSVYGRLLTKDHDLDRACRFGRLALDLAHRFDLPSTLSQTYLYANYQLMHWKTPLAELACGFQQAVEFGVAAGSPFNAACSATTYCICQFWAGESLASLASDLDGNRELVSRFRQPVVMNWHEILCQLVANLRTDSPEPTVLKGKYYDEALRLAIHRQFGDVSALFNYHVAKALLCYLFEDFDGALGHVRGFEPMLPVFGSDLWAGPVTYLTAIVRLAASERAAPAARDALLDGVRENLQKLVAWLPHNRRSLAHKVATIQAALERLNGNLERARQLSADATELARREGSALEEAVAWELNARLWSETAEAMNWRRALRNAHRAYARWGAIAKLKELERRHPRILPHTIAGAVSFASGAGGDPDVDSLDLVSVLNASRAISGEMRLEAVLTRLMEFLIETAGAQAGYLLLPKNGQWVVECGQSSEHGAVTMLESIPLKDFAGSEVALPTSVIHYVAGTAETLLLDDARADERFARDPNVVRRGISSVLCFPLHRMGKLVAIAYLENRISRGAFTTGRLKVLQMLCTQAVISLENAMLYDGMERKISERTHELQERNAELGAALVQVQEIQQQLATQEKLAAMGALTAGVAHEIRNPLNFIINFAEVGNGLTSEIRQALSGPERNPSALDAVAPLFERLGIALAKIAQHGARANAIVTGMALHARESTGVRESVDINRLLAQSLNLAFHGTIGAGGGPVKLTADYAQGLPLLDVVVQDISRVVVNVVANACHSVEQKRKAAPPGFVGELRVSTRDVADRVEVRFWDNGVGIPVEARDKVFLPFFTTKPSGEGTGLGLSITHDIVVRGHSGQIRLQSEEGAFAEVIVELPKRRIGGNGPAVA